MSFLKNIQEISQQWKNKKFNLLNFPEYCQTPKNGGREELIKLTSLDVTAFFSC